MGDRDNASRVTTKSMSMRQAPNLPLQDMLFLRRLAWALIGAFAVTILVALFPLRLMDPLWQLRMANTLLATAPFALLGTGVIYLEMKLSPGETAERPSQMLRRIQRMSTYVALGFFLLIPLMLHASWSQLRQADSETQQTLRSIDRRLNAVRTADSNGALQQLTQGLPQSWQPISDRSLESNRRDVLAKLEPQLARIRTQSQERRRSAIEKTLQSLLRDCIVTALYGFAFTGLRETNHFPEDMEVYLPETDI